MDCVKPILAWRTGTIRCKSDGQLSPKIEFSPRRAEQYFRSRFGAIWPQAMTGQEIRVPCGKCPNCLARKRALMSVRLAHERSMTDKACFITLTYDENNCPATDYLVNDNPNKSLSSHVDKDHPLRTLCPSDVQLFLKRLRRHLEYVPKRTRQVRDHVSRIRYFLVGEYGTRTGRPHYHLIVFGWWPSDAEPFKGHDYTSAQIAKLWPHGFHLLSQVTESACKYCAQYVTKKLVKPNDPYTDRRCPEFFRQSIKGGSMGIPWLLRWHSHVMAVGHVTFRAGDRILKSAIPPSYVHSVRKYFPSEWLEWRKRCMEHMSICESSDVIQARAQLRLEYFKKAVMREKL